MKRWKMINSRDKDLKIGIACNLNTSKSVEAVSKICKQK